MAVWLFALAGQWAWAGLWLNAHLAWGVGWWLPWALLGVAILFGVAFWFKPRLAKSDFIQRWWSFVVVEFALALMGLHAIWQMSVYWRRPWMAHGAIVVLGIYAILHKIFWPQIRNFAVMMHAFATDKNNSSLLKPVAQGFLLIVIALVLYIPDMEAVVARDFLGQQFHHADGSLIGAAFAYAKGATLYVDNASYYGLGMPVIVAQLTKVFGGFTYDNIFKVLMWMGIVYYALVFSLLRVWFKDTLLALACLAMAWRVQMFQWGVVPIVWTTPQASILRFCFDILVLWMIYWHVTKGQWRYLVVGAMGCAVALYHMSSTGVWLAAAFYFYLLFVWSHTKDWRRVLMIAAIVPSLTALLFWWTVGPALLSKAFWANMGEFLNFFLSFFGTAPYAMHLKNKNFMLLLMGLVYPLVYVITLTSVAALCWLRKIRKEHIMAAVLAVYGLGLYQYFVVVTSNYYAAGLPFIFIVFWWVKIAGAFLQPVWARRLRWGVLGMSLYALVTCQLFIAYPNVFNFSRNPMVDPKVAPLLDNHLYYFNQLFTQYPEAFKLPQNSLGEVNEDLRTEKDFSSDEELKTYFHKETDFAKDAGLIMQLTAPGSRVPLVSSFDILFLMQSHRRPFFYFCPLTNARPLRMRIFITTHLFTKQRLQKTIAQLEEEKPPYLFMERIFLTPQVPQAYFWDSVDFMNLLAYVLKHYEPYQNGEYLVAMKRR